jgi:hypothetical protein
MPVLRGLSPVGVLEFFGFGEVFEGIQAEDFEEPLGRAVEHGAAEDLGPPGDLDEALVPQAAEDLAGSDAPDCLDVGPDDRLFARGPAVTCWKRAVGPRSRPFYPHVSDDA